MTRAAYTTRVDWDDDGAYNTTHDNVTSRTLDDRTTVTMRYGREQSRALSPISPGEAEFELNNASRDYSIDNASSPLFGNVLPGRDVLIEGALAGTADTFNRTASNGWGTSSSGHAWTTGGGTAGNYAVAPSAGTLTLASVNVSRRVSLVAATSRCRVRATVSVDAVATGAAIRVGIIPRGTTLADDHQRAQLNFDLSGVLSLTLVERVATVDNTLATHTLDGTYTANEQFTVIAETVGRTLRAKAWPTGDPEPAAWQVTADVDEITASVIGVRALSSTGNTNTNPVVAVRNWSSTLHGALFRGHLDDVDLLPEPGQRSLKVTCADPLARLKDVNVSSELYTGIRTGEAIGVLLDRVGWPADLRDLDPGASVLPFWWLDSADAYASLMELVDSEGPPALVTADADGQFVFRDRHHRLLRSASTTSQATWRSGGTEPNYSAPLVYGTGLKEIVNTVTFDVPVRAPAGELAAVFSMQGQISVANGETVPVTARASDPFIGALVPVAGTDFQLLSGVVQTTLSRTSGIATTVFVKAVGGPAVLTDLQVRAYPIATQATVQVQAEDSVSIDKHKGRRSLPSGRDPVWASVHDARAIADLILGQRAERLPTLSLTFRGGNETRLTQQLARDLSDRVTVDDTNTGLDGDCFVEQITHTIRQGGAEHTTTFGVEKAVTVVEDLFMFDVSGRGFNDGKFGGVGRDDPDTMFLFDTAGQGFNDGLLAH